MHKAPSRWPVVLIAMDKLIKAGGLVVFCFFLKQLPIHRDVWLEFVTERHIFIPVQRALIQTLSISEKTGHTLNLIALIGAGLYLIEGVGLIWDLKWAEWLVVISTASFIPIEVFEIAVKPSGVKIAVLVINAAILAYLTFRLHRLQVVQRERAAAGLPLLKKSK